MITPALALAAVGAPPFLSQLVILIVASALIAYACTRMGILPIVGFLIAGVIIGPNALGLVRDSTLIDLVAEIGVVLLLFTLGIEFRLDRLARIKRAIFLAGGLQVVLTIAAVTAVLGLMGIDWRAGIFTGSLVALSSTAIVMKVLGDSDDTASRRGQLALAMLIFQDLAIVALVMIVPMLSGDGGSAAAMLRGIGLAVAIVALVLVVARRFMPPLLERVGRTCAPEVFLLTVIAICIGTAWLTSLAGVSLSLGAFLAGLVVSESRYSHHAFAEILPLQILFSAVFFVSVGMLLDLQFVLRHPLMVAGVVAAVIVLKFITGTAAGLALAYPAGVAAGTALLVSQIGEFSFVLERVGRPQGLHPAGSEAIGGQIFIASAVILMAITPLLARLSKALESRWSERRAAPRDEHEAVERVELDNHVIVAGYGSGARYLTRVLRDSGVPFVIVTLSPTGATEAEREQLRVLLGDYSRQRILELVGIDTAKMLVIADDAADMARRVAGTARAINPTLQIVVRAHATTEVEELLAAGADEVLVDEMEIGIQLFTRVLSDYQVSNEEIDDHVATVRAGGYAALRSEIRDEPLVVCSELDDSCFDTRTFTVREGSAAAGMELRRFAEERGISISAVARGGKRIEIGPGIELQPNDRITARASAEAFRAAAALLRAGAGAADDSAAPPARIITLDPEQRTAPGCAHVASVEREITTTAVGCEDCLRIGDEWVHLRICMSCGGVRCCDSSKNRHATAHYRNVGHPIIKSYQRGEEWGFCYVDQVSF